MNLVLHLVLGSPEVFASTQRVLSCVLLVGRFPAILTSVPLSHISQGARVSDLSAQRGVLLDTTIEPTSSMDGLGRLCHNTPTFTSSLSSWRIPLDQSV